MMSDRIYPKIGWGSYAAYEGPWFKGSVPFRLPSTREPTFLEKVAAVITATEGGMLDAYNGYDRCVCTVGFIQWGEACAAGRPVSKMVSMARVTDQAWVDSLLGEARLRMSPHSSRPAIVTLDAETDIPTTFLATTGLKGSWNDSTRAYAKRVAAVLATLFGDSRSHQAQSDYTMPRILDFTFGDARKILFPDDFLKQPKLQDGYDGALRAILLSFAANLPAVAGRRVDKNTLGTDRKADCIALAKRLTFEPNIAIYPGRFDKIRPVVEKLFGVDLPDFAAELKTWKAVVQPHIAQFPDTASWQNALLALDYDLGPAGADGKDGPKTRAAVKAFQQRYGLTADGLVGPKTLAKLAEVAPVGPKSDRPSE